MAKRMKLATASVAQQNAAFDVVYQKLMDLAEKQSWPIHDKAINWLQSREGRTLILTTVDEALNAALAEGEKEAQK